MKKLDINEMQRWCEGRCWDNLIKIYSKKEIYNFGIDPYDYLMEGEILCEIYFPDYGFYVVKCKGIIEGGEVFPDKIIEIVR